MVNALNINELNKRTTQNYGPDEKRIVGIILARYDLPIVQSIIDSCYLYWHENTNNYVDFFWAGYGEYLSPTDVTNDKIILKFDGNDTHVYYDRQAFISIKKEFNKIFKKTHQDKILKKIYQDKLQLILVNYRDGGLQFDESILIDLEENLDSNFTTIRELIEYITFECANMDNVTDLAKKLRHEHFNDNVRKQIKSIIVSDVVGIAIGLAGLIL